MAISPDVTDNPYWDALQPHVRSPEFEHEPPYVERWSSDGSEVYLDRRPFTREYSWTITDPDSVGFVVGYAEAGLVDPMAGTGYWAYVLGQEGVDVVCYDESPGEDNPWHIDKLWVPVTRMDGAEAVAKHPDRTLLLSWPPYNEPDGDEVLAAYAGDRVIFMGEGEGGATGDDDLFTRLDAEWQWCEEHMPIRWYGLYDRIAVYERRPAKQRRRRKRALVGSSA